jgi:hypothetical protein
VDTFDHPGANAGQGRIRLVMFDSINNLRWGRANGVFSTIQLQFTNPVCGLAINLRRAVTANHN